MSQDYASNTQAKKLWALLKTHHKNKTASRTYGALDPIQVIQMGKFLDTIYVSGWQCSSTASTSNEPGPDLADYPMDTVPNKVEHSADTTLTVYASKLDDTWSFMQVIQPV
ncbi:hypothetical protein HDU81_004670 [Chytriomyces hyalinus]|nr:hypothetical protein HDU81_004670 [Chytriomyces hyalinus]